LKVKVISLNEEALENRDYRDILAIEINGQCKFEVYDGEPEDANLSRDFNSCWKIPKLMKSAYEAGKNGEEFTIINEEVDEY